VDTRGRRGVFTATEKVQRKKRQWKIQLPENCWVLILTLIFCCLFSYPLIFRCRVFLLPNFPVAQSSIAVISVALFMVAVFTF